MDYKGLESLLGNIHEEMLQNMLNDLRNPDKRSPQLYNAIIKELERNGIDCVPKAVEGEENALSKLLKATRENFENSYRGDMSVN
jgi:hypothetical protein